MAGTQGASIRGRNVAAGVAVAAIVVLGLCGWGGVLPTVPSPFGHGTAAFRGPLVSNCDGGQWSTAHLLVWGSGCEALFGVEYANSFSNWNSSQSYNFTFTIPSVAELSPAGGLVRLADAMNPSAATTTVASTPGEVNITLAESINVTAASGGWTPNDTAWGSGPQWSNGTVPVGVASLSVVFHLFNASTGPSGNNSYRVKFDIHVDGWPWAAAGDGLGIAVQALAAGGAHFAFNASAGALVESWNSNGTAFVSLAFGPGAAVGYPTGPGSTATVTTQTGLFPGGTPDRQAVSLVRFGGVSGGYDGLAYDPWVSFTSSPLLGPSTNEPLVFSTAGGPYGAVVLVSAIAVVAGAVTVGVFVRQRRSRRAGEALVAGIEQWISEGPPPRP